MSNRALEPTEPKVVATDQMTPQAIVEALLGAMKRGEITSKFAVMALVRLAPARRPVVSVPGLPPIRDSSSFAEACAHVVAEVGAGRVAPADALQLLKAFKMTHAALKDAARARR
jgi:hypothetical protein